MAIIVLVASYLLDMAMLTKNLPRVPADLMTSQDTWVRIARWVPIWVTYTFFGLGCLMLSVLVLAFTISIFQPLQHPMAMAPGVVFFGLGVWVAFCVLRMARRLRRAAVAAV